MRVGPNGEVHIGDARGKVVLHLDEQSAYDLAAMMRYDDQGHIELIEAVALAYPPDDEDEAGDVPGLTDQDVDELVEILDALKAEEQRP